MKGFAFGVKDKLNELTKLKESYIEEKGLVPIAAYEESLNELKDLMDITERKSRSIKYNTKGREAGRQTAIHKGVGKQSETKLIGG